MGEDRERRRGTRRGAQVDDRFSDGQASIDAYDELIGPDGKVIDRRDDPPPPPEARPKCEKDK